MSLTDRGMLINFSFVRPPVLTLRLQVDEGAEIIGRGGDWQNCQKLINEEGLDKGKLTLS